ncbi:hypothetical protein BU16DRAFT_613760 [Lophium mytilinum]|uniref:Uncharacterized protein n=1 Tax=Lophium mytilinum TaxID=390894 RepID=A0A6A6R5C1_9PEZI|nr:hypothetical protein BU16DRAFT_613760 [Lophium mytilinum]
MDVNAGHHPYHRHRGVEIPYYPSCYFIRMEDEGSESESMDGISNDTSSGPSGRHTKFMDDGQHAATSVKDSAKTMSEDRAHAAEAGKQPEARNFHPEETTGTTNAVATATRGESPKTRTVLAEIDAVRERNRVHFEERRLADLVLGSAKDIIQDLERLLKDRTQKYQNKKQAWKDNMESAKRGHQEELQNLEAGNRAEIERMRKARDAAESLGLKEQEQLKAEMYRNRSEWYAKERRLKSTIDALRLSGTRKDETITQLTSENEDLQKRLAAGESALPDSNSDTSRKRRCFYSKATPRSSQFAVIDLTTDAYENAHTPSPGN